MENSHEYLLEKHRCSYHIKIFIPKLRSSFFSEFEDTKGIIRIRKSKKNRHNGKKKNNRRTNNDQQSTTQKTKDRVTRTPIKTGGELRCSGRVGGSCSTSYNRRATLAKAGYMS